MAERSAVKRIQEQDSPASSPMVLVVSQLYWEDPPILPESEMPLGLDGSPRIPDGPQVSGFQLTDGWYRLNAKIDPVLAFAAKRGKIKIGSKIAITGAKVC